MKIINFPKDWDDLYNPLKLMKEKGELSVLNPQIKLNIYNFPFTTNPYTGCNYGCIYCYSTQSEDYKKLWGSNINCLRPEPKRNYVNRLKQDLYELDFLPNEYKELQVGNTFDPYPPIEQKEELTRKCLDLFYQFSDWKVHIETKSDMILRDIDILRRLSSRDKFIEVEITIATLKRVNEFEPGAPSIQKRFKAMETLADNDVFVRVMIMPVLGDYTDINEIIQQSYEHGAKDFKIKDLKHFTIGQLVKDYNIPSP